MKYHRCSKFQLTILLYFGVLLSAFPLQAQLDSPPAYKIYAVQQQKTITLPELVEAVDKADVLFFGEEHNDSIAHVLQDTIYQLLLEKYKQVTLSLEMFEADGQYILDEYLGGYITESKMIKDARAWNNYKTAYKPLVETAKSQKQDVIAANAPNRYVNMVGRNGLDALDDLPDYSKRFLPPLPIYTSDSSYYQRFQKIMEGAGHSASSKMYAAQCVWDAAMAHNIYTYWRKHEDTRIFHLNGRFHTDFKQGTMNQLQRKKKKMNMLNISCIPVETAEFDAADWTTYLPFGDFIILTLQTQ
jgi:uncharacterized iron-regulated protein